MAYSYFLKDLFAEGRVTAPEFAPLSDDELSAGDEVIAEYEQTHRLEMPGTPPPFVLAAGRWAAFRFFRACQFAVYRDLDEQSLKQELGQPFSEPIDAAAHYSVDLVFRYLPDLAKFAGSAAERDPLRDILRGWAIDWPLSSVGMSDVDPVVIDGFAENNSLMQLYADRIISTGDKSRLSAPAAEEAVRRALGLFTNLAPNIATTLSNTQTENNTE